MHPSNINNPTFTLIDSGSSVDTVPSSHMLTPFHSCPGLTLIAADRSSIPTLGHGSYSPNKNITLNNVQLSPSIPSPIISVSSLTHDHKKIVVFSYPISCIIDNTLTNQETLQQLIASPSSVTDPIHISLDPTDRLFKLPVSPPRDTHMSPVAVSHTPTTPPHPPILVTYLPNYVRIAWE